jgi:hypothetical protein
VNSDPVNLEPVNLEPAKPDPAKPRERLAAPRGRSGWRLLTWVVPGLIAAAAIAYFVAPPYAGYWRYEPREGDVVFQSLPRNPLVGAIEGVTHSPYSHCGLVAHEDGGWYVYEALGNVIRTPLYDWWDRGRGHALAVYRLGDEYQPRVPKMIEYARGLMGRPYDTHYSMDDERIYCSELVFKAFQAATGEPLGEVVRFGDLDWKPYRKLVEQVEEGPVPVDRMMVPPRQLSEAKQLHEVCRFGFIDD